MNRDIAEKWVDALRSGEYTQIKHRLAKDGPYEKDHCFLGVLCELAIKEGLPVTKTWDEYHQCYRYGDFSTDVLPDIVKVWAGMRSPEGSYENGDACLSANNDSSTDPHDFNRIAEVIESRVDEL